MPTYDYECEKCGHRFERFQGMSDAPLRACPECSGRLRRLISGGAGVFIKSPAPTCAASCANARECPGRDAPSGRLPCRGTD